MPTNRKVPDQNYNIIDTKLTHLLIIKKFLKNSFDCIKGALVNNEMYSQILVSDKMSGFDVPDHK